MARVVAFSFVFTGKSENGNADEVRGLSVSAAAAESTANGRKAQTSRRVKGISTSAKQRFEVADILTISTGAHVCFLY
jgi:hypothetical protein